MSTAVVTLAHGRHDHLVAQRRSLILGDRRPDHYVVVSVDDPWIDDWAPTGAAVPDVVRVAGDPLGLPLARARNAGVRRALELGADVVVLLDVDCLAGRHLVSGYAHDVTAEPGTVWSGPVTYLPPAGPGGYDLRTLADRDAPHAARPAPAPGDRVLSTDPDLFWSLSFALHRDAWERVVGFDEAYVGYGAEDTDFAQRILAAGVALGWTGSARAYHQHHATTSPPVQHLDDILRNGAIFHDHWGRWPMTGWLEAFERDGLVVRSGDGWVATPT